MHRSYFALRHLQNSVDARVFVAWGDWARATGSDQERTANFRFRSLSWRAISSLSSNTGIADALETSMERPAWAPQGIDISVPSVSRIYDYYLGGSHNFEVDREAARKAMEFMPGLPKIMQANRAFMRRAVRLRGRRGHHPVPGHRLRHPDLRQRPRGGPGGQPRAPASCTSTTTRSPSRTARRSWRATTDAAVVAADLRKPQEILDEPGGSAPHRPEPARRAAARCRTALRRGRGRPVGRGGGAAGRARARQPAGRSRTPRTRESRSPQERADGAVDVYRDIRNPLIMRSREEIARFFEGYEMVEPGLVSMPHWRPDTGARAGGPVCLLGVRRRGAQGVSVGAGRRTGRRRTDCAGSRRSGAGPSSR